MGRQVQLHVLPRDVNELLVAMHDKEPLDVAWKSGDTAVVRPLGFISDNLKGKTLVLWNKRFAPELQRSYIASADPPYYRVDEEPEPVFELSLSRTNTWEGRAALMQGRIYATFENKPQELEKSYERLVRFIRRHWRKNPATWMGGYLGKAASEWFDGGGLLLPNYLPPVRSDWVKRLGEQHPDS